jgi:3-oxoacyl-[acyl-carrier-protein] synthase-3
VAELHFSDASLTGLVTTVGSRVVEFDDEREALGLNQQYADRLKKSFGFSKRHVTIGPETTADLCRSSAQALLSGQNINPTSIDALIMITQTPDYAAPSSAISLASRLGLTETAMAFDMRLGCSGFVYGLAVASSLVQSGLKRVLVCVGDVASRMVPERDHTITPIMGDAGAAALVEHKPSRSIYHMYSDGTGERALFIPNSGLRRLEQDVGKPPLMTMDGTAVFNFTLQRVPAMIADILKASSWSAGEVDYYVLHQPNKYILKNVQKSLKIEDERFPTSTQSVYGNLNSASIPATISGFLNEQFTTRKLRSIFSGFGIGLSWAACAVETEAIFAPPIRLYADAQETAELGAVG